MAKSYQDYLNKLGNSEGKNTYDVHSPHNHIGKYQMGEEALQDAGYYNGDSDPRVNNWQGTWTGKDGVNSEKDFLDNVNNCQENAIRAYVQKQWDYIVNLRLDKYLGKTINGAVITKSGLIAGEHLGGPVGLQKYLESDGKINRADILGTTIGKYISKFSGYEIDDAGAPPQPLPEGEYTVKAGDTLSKIAKDHGLTLRELLDANPEITNPNLIISGQKIRLSPINDGEGGFGIPLDSYPLQYDWLNSKMKFIRDCFKKAEVTLSPIILDLDRDGIETTALAGGVYFDHDGNGFAEQTGWVSPDDGLLVMDRNNDGIINDGTELFGDNTILQNGQKAANGFQALAELDDNHDGKIDANDSAFSSLKVWQDIDGDNYSSTYELLTLNELGIQSINTGYTNSTLVDEQGNEHRQEGSFTWSDGMTGTATDVWFQTDKIFTVVKEWLGVPEDIATLPDLQGYGNVYDLQQAMVRDESGHLKNLVEQFAAETDAAARHDLVIQILYAWTGVENVDPLSRAARMIYGNAIGDARKLATLEAFMGEGYFGTWCWNERDPNPHGPAAKILLQAFDELSDSTYSQLMAQTHFSDVFDSISMTWNDDSSQFDWDVSAVPEKLQALYISDPDNAPLAMSEFADILKLAGDPGLQAMEDLRAQGK